MDMGKKAGNRTGNRLGRSCRTGNRFERSGRTGSRLGKSGVLLLCLLTVCLVFAGCAGGGSQGESGNAPAAGSGGSGTSGSGASGTGADGTKQAEEAEPAAQQGNALPIVSEPLTLSYFTTIDSTVAASMKTYNEIEAYKELEKRTGIHIDFKHPNIGTEQDQFKLMIASGDLTDVIQWYWSNYPGGPEKALSDGTIIRLNELIDQHAPNLKKLLDEHPEYRKAISTDDGSLYIFPFLQPDPYLVTYAGLTLRQDWLDRVGLPVPTTIDEWHTVLKAFKEQDPNGNGAADEIPFNPTMWGSYKTGFDFVHAFIGAWGITTSFYQENGQVKFGPIEPEFKEFLTLMRDWYKEGLIDPDYVATSGELMDAKITGDLVGSMPLAVGSGIGNYTGLMKDKNPAFKLVPAPYPVLQAGDRPLVGQKDNMFNGLGVALTEDNKHPVETAKWLDYTYGEEGHNLMAFGIEGVSYNMIDGYPTYSDVIMKNPDGLSFSQAVVKYALPYGGPWFQDKRYLEQATALPVQKQAIDTWLQPTNDWVLPSVNPSEAESSKFASIMADINTYYGEMFDKFIMGSEPLDSFDNFTDTLKKMGIEEAIQIKQAALDRYNERG